MCLPTLVSDCPASGSVIINHLSSAGFPSSRWQSESGVPAATGSQASNHTVFLLIEGPALADSWLHPPLVSMHEHGMCD